MGGFVRTPRWWFNHLRSSFVFIALSRELVYLLLGVVMWPLEHRYQPGLGFPSEIQFMNEDCISIPLQLMVAFTLKWPGRRIQNEKISVVTPSFLTPNTNGVRLDIFLLDLIQTQSRNVAEPTHGPFTEDTNCWERAQRWRWRCCYGPCDKSKRKNGAGSQPRA